jgi:hypothetical protein
MAVVQNNNINSLHDKPGIYTYGKFRVREKKFRYCFQCGKELEDGSNLEFFCDQWCRSEYCAEIRNEEYARYNEFRGID